MGKVIDLVPHLKTNTLGSDARMSASAGSTGIVDLKEQKEKMLFQERRQVRRTILTELISAMVVLPEKGLLKVNLFDVSEDGLSFDLEADAGRFKVGEELSVRIYLNHKTYFPMQIMVKHVTFDQDEGVNRHGTEFLKTASTDVALQHFVRFIESASAGLKKDQGDLMVTRTS